MLAGLNFLGRQKHVEDPAAGGLAERQTVPAIDLGLGRRRARGDRACPRTCCPGGRAQDQLLLDPPPLHDAAGRGTRCSLHERDVRRSGRGSRPERPLAWRRARVTRSRGCRTPVGCGRSDGPREALLDHLAMASTCWLSSTSRDHPPQPLIEIRRARHRRVRLCHDRSSISCSPVG